MGSDLLSRSVITVQVIISLLRLYCMCVCRVVLYEHCEETNKGRFSTVCRPCNAPLYNADLVVTHELSSGPILLIFPFAC